MAAGSQVTVDDTAGGTVIVTGSGAGGSRVEVTNRHASASVFLGGAGVTTAAGYELKTGETRTVHLKAGEVLRGIVASGTVVVHALKTLGDA